MPALKLLAAPPGVASMPLTTTVAGPSATVPLTMMSAAENSVPGVGEEMLTTGATVSRITEIDAVPTLPAGSVAVAVTTLSPSLARGTPTAVKMPASMVAGTPLTTTVAVASLTVPVTVIRLKLNASSAAGVAMATTGGVTSRLISPTSPAALAAASATAMVMTSSARPWSMASKLPSAPASTTTTSPLRLLVSVTVAPASTAPGAPVMVRFPLPSGPLRVTRPRSAGCGATVSSVTLTLVVPRLPATSLTATSTRFNPSARSTLHWKLSRVNAAAGLPAQLTSPTPDRASTMVPVSAATGLLVRLASAGDVTATTGAVRSRLTVMLACALLPALSTAVPATAWPAPSAVTDTGAVQLAIPLSASWQSKLTVTSSVCQPSTLAGGATMALISGGVVSSPPAGGSTCTRAW